MGNILAIILGAVVVLIGAVLLFFKLRPKNTEIVYHHFFCTGCKRKLRYRAEQVGNKGKCPRCGKGLVFPPILSSKKAKK
jgi:rRNA maturation endonuclease Nob1